MTEVSKNIAKAITEEPIIFEVTPRLSFYKSLLAKVGLVQKVRRFSIYPATLGMLQQMDEYSENIVVGELNTINEAISSVSKNSMDTCRFLAVAILRTNGAVARAKVNRLAEFLHNNLTSKGLSALLNAVVKQSDVAFFLSIMASVGKKPKTEVESLGKLTAPLGESQVAQ